MEDAAVPSEPCLLVNIDGSVDLHQFGTKSPYHHDIPALAGKENCYAYNEWMAVKDVDSPDCFLLNLASLERIQLPPVSFRFNLFILTSHPTDPVCRVVLYDQNKKALAFCRPGEEKFIRQKTRRYRTPRQFILVAGKIYFYLLGDLMCIEFEDKTCSSRRLKLGVTGDLLADYLRGRPVLYYLAFYSGDFFLVNRCFYEKYNNSLTWFQVWKADFSKQAWVEVKNIAPLTIFITQELDGTAHICCPTIDSGITSNAIYFTEDNDMDYYRYRLDEESITMYHTGCIPDETPLFCSWVALPHDTNLLQRNHIELKEEEERQDSAAKLEERESLLEEEDDSWANLPPELLSEILSRLFSRDYAAFHGVCKSWQRITGQHSFYSPPSILRQESNVPLLMFLEENRDVPVYKLFDPLHRKYQRLEIPELRGADIKYSKHGWLLASRRHVGSLFFLNPLTGEKIEVLSDPVAFTAINIYFSSPPTSSDCLIVAVMGFGLSTRFMSLRRSENIWRNGWSYDDKELLLPCSSPVVYDGLHYYACQDRRVVAFDFSGDEIRCVNRWSTSLEREVDNDDNRYNDEDFMIEIDGVPALVTVPRYREKIDIFKWELVENDWVRMEETDLGDRDVFLSHRSSFLRRVDDYGGNKIFLPLIDTDAMDGVFYSLKTRMYHTFYSGYCSESSYSVAKFYGGIWVEPLYTKSSEENLTWV